MKYSPVATKIISIERQVIHMGKDETWLDRLMDDDMEFYDVIRKIASIPQINIRKIPANTPKASTTASQT